MTTGTLPRKNFPASPWDDHVSHGKSTVFRASRSARITTFVPTKPTNTHVGSATLKILHVTLLAGTPT